MSESEPITGSTTPEPGSAPEPESAPQPDPELRRKSRIAMVKYGLARIALFVALPLSMLVFTKWRVEATESLAEYSRQRKERKEWIQRELAGR